MMMMMSSENLTCRRVTWRHVKATKTGGLGAKSRH